MDWWFIAIVIAAIILVVVIVVLSESPPAPPPDPPTPPDPPGSPVLEPIGPTYTTPATCGPGTVEWSGNCYKDLWTAQGGIKTSFDSVYYGPYGGVKTKCGIGIYYLKIGEPCPMIGPNYYVTAVCTCQYKGSISSALYNQYTGKPTTCPTGSQFFKGKCYYSLSPKRL
jgi:hypothetical protein